MQIHHQDQNSEKAKTCSTVGCVGVYYSKSLCKRCYSKQDYHKNKDKNRSKRKEQCKKYYSKYRERILERDRSKRLSREYKKNESQRYKKYYSKNREKELARCKRYRERNRDSYNAARRIRKKKIKEATPKWVNREDILDFYKNRPTGCHVDHIVPLKGKGVCGLHVPWNLQYLPAVENLKKGNKF